MTTETTMDKIKNWINAIRNEDGHNLSSGSLTTLKMIEDETAPLLARISEQKFQIDELIRTAGNTQDSLIQQIESLKKQLEEKSQEITPQ